MYCTACGRLSKDDYKFCANCGTKRATAPAANITESITAFNQPDKQEIKEIHPETINSIVDEFSQPDEFTNIDSDDFTDTNDTLSLGGEDIFSLGESVPQIFPVENTSAEDSYASPYNSSPHGINFKDLQNLQNPQDIKPPKEKYFFGKGALMLCLTAIAILSVTAGMFIGLYFDQINKRGANSSVGEGNMSYSQTE